MTPQASRHHRGTGSGRAQSRPVAILGDTEGLGAVEATDIGSGDALILARIAENLDRFLNESTESRMRRLRRQGNMGVSSG